MKIAQTIIEAVLDFAFPRICVGCGASADADGSGVLCETCRATLKPLDGELCLRCSHPVGKHMDTSRGCGNCRGRDYKYDSVFAAGLYDGVLREVLLAFKYERRRDLQSEISGFMQGGLLSRLSAGEVDLVCPVPMHASRLRKRGFNQAGLLARPLAAALGVPVDLESLKRVRNTRPQVGLAFTARQKNVKDAFAGDKGTFEGRCVLLVDDIFTTGATGSECARALKDAGARKVIFVVAARQSAL